MRDLAPGFANAIGAALDAAAAEMNEPAFAVVYFAPDQRVPSGTLTDRERMEAARAFSEAPDDVLRLVHLDAPGRHVQLDIDAHMDPETRAACDAFVERARTDYEAASQEIKRLKAEHGHERAWELQTGFAKLEANRAELEALKLDVAKRVQAVAERPLVIWPSSRDDALWETTIEAAGSERVDALRVAIATPANRTPSDPLPPPKTRADVLTIARQAGFDLPTAKRIADSALTGLALHARRNAPGRSQLGGGADLPHDVDWPHKDGEPLTLIATIALDELPDADQRDLLPATGRLLFFVEADAQPPARILYIPDDVPTQRHEPDHALEPLPVHATPVITLPDAWALGLKGLEGRRFDPVAHAGEMARRDPEFHWEGWEGAHQILGHPQPLQDDPRQGDQVLLLQVSSDHRFGFSHMDGGGYYFLIAPEALRERRWEDVTVEDSSL